MSMQPDDAEDPIAHMETKAARELGASGGPEATALSDALVYADALFDTVREPLVVLDEDLVVRRANKAFYQAFRVGPGAAVGRRIYELGNGQWDIPRLRTLLEEIIPEERQQEVFEIFRRLHPRDVYPGDGVGLALCRRIVARHDGRIWAESPPDGQEMGTAFPFTMPKDQERPQP